MLEAALDYTDDTNFEPISPVKNLDENAMWHIGKNHAFKKYVQFTVDSNDD